MPPAHSCHLYAGSFPISSVPVRHTHCLPTRFPHQRDSLRHQGTAQSSVVYRNWFRRKDSVPRRISTCLYRGLTPTRVPTTIQSRRRRSQIYLFTSICTGKRKQHRAATPTDDRGVILPMAFGSGPSLHSVSRSIRLTHHSHTLEKVTATHFVLQPTHSDTTSKFGASTDRRAACRASTREKLNRHGKPGLNSYVPNREPERFAFRIVFI